LQHYFAADGDKYRHSQNCQRSNVNHFLPSRSHVQSSHMLLGSSKPSC
jgi:hypothetical protein